MKNDFIKAINFNVLNNKKTLKKVERILKNI